MNPCELILGEFFLISIFKKILELEMSRSFLGLVTFGLIGLLNLNGFSGKVEKWERPEVIFPVDNPYSDASVELGSALFFESLLSKDSTLSCQSCHLNDVAFADHLPVGEGIKGRKVTRNTPSLMNIGLHPYFMADGKFASLEDQVMGPINEHREFDMNAKEVVKRLKTYPYYNELSQKAYGTEITIEVVQKAIANFERIIVSDQSKFDRFKRGEISLTKMETEGWKLFTSTELKCHQCHSGFNFTNYAFENNGLYEVYADSGRALITKEPKDLAKFKVPSLRNIGLTAPYMHNGSVNTLDEVIAHYASGGREHFSKSDLIQGFQISDAEKEALIAFLHTLTEERLVGK